MTNTKYFQQILDAANELQVKHNFETSTNLEGHTQWRFFVHDAIHTLTGCGVDDAGEEEIAIITNHLVLNNLISRKLSHLDKELVFILQQLMR